MCFPLDRCIANNLKWLTCEFKSFFKDAFDYEMTLDSLRKAKAGETVTIPIYDAVNATR